jgi:hypothetical protein
MQKKFTYIVLASILGLSACDTYNRGSDLERAAIGAAIGCAAGEIIDNGKCITGAAIGGAAGALSNDI